MPISHPRLTSGLKAKLLIERAGQLVVAASDRLPQSKSVFGLERKAPAWLDRSQLHYTHEDGLRLAASRSLPHHVEANEFFTRLVVDANRAGGALTEWYGVRTLAHLFDGALIPDGWGVLCMPGRPPLHLLLELDRGTESSRVLREKAKRYRDILPDSSISEHNPIVILAVPSPRRAQTAAEAITNITAPMAVTVWNTATIRSVLATVTTCVAEAHVHTLGGAEIFSQH